MLKIISLVSFIIIGSFSALAQKQQITGQPPQFTSVYTDLSRDCKSAFNAKEEKEAASRGQDIPLKCKGFGNYYAYISYSAYAASLSIGNRRDDSSIQITTQGLNFNEEKNKKLEWRLANGTPFAVILRVSNYKFPADLPMGASPFDAKYKTGETLVVRGLLGHEQIEYDIDAKLADANEQARQRADEAFK